MSRKKKTRGTWQIEFEKIMLEKYGMLNPRLRRPGNVELSPMEYADMITKRAGIDRILKYPDQCVCGHMTFEPSKDINVLVCSVCGHEFRLIGGEYV